MPSSPNEPIAPDLLRRNNMYANQSLDHPLQPQPVIMNYFPTPTHHQNTPMHSRPNSPALSYFQPQAHRDTMETSHSSNGLPAGFTMLHLTDDNELIPTNTLPSPQIIVTAAQPIADTPPASDSAVSRDPESGFSKRTTKRIKWIVAIILSMFASAVAVYALAKKAFND